MDPGGGGNFSPGDPFDQGGRWVGEKKILDRETSRQVVDMGHCVVRTNGHQGRRRGTLGGHLKL